MSGRRSIQASPTVTAQAAALRGGVPAAASFEEDIANIIKGIAFYDIQVENMRIGAAENPNFDAVTVWGIIDVKRRGIVDAQNLITFLAANRIAVSEKEATHLVKLFSKRTAEYLEKSDFIDFLLPQTNNRMKDMSLRRREKGGLSEQKHARLHIDRVVQRTSESIASQLIELEIDGFREIEKLKKSLASTYGINVQKIFKVVDAQDVGIIDFKVLQDFFARIGVSFNRDEFRALISRTTEDGDDKLDYEELIYTLMPIDPYGYAAFKQSGTTTQKYEYMLSKAAEFHSDIGSSPNFYPENMTLKSPRVKKQHTLNATTTVKYTSYDRPIREVLSTEQMQYHYDEAYMKQLDSYKQLYYQPSREYNLQYANRFVEGMRYHDQHFDRYFKHLHDRGHNEHLFNKFGKRYAFDSSISGFAEQIARRKAAISLESNQFVYQEVKQGRDEDRLSSRQNNPETSYSSSNKQDNVTTAKFQQGQFQLEKQQQQKPSSSSDRIFAGKQVFNYGQTQSKQREAAEEEGEYDYDNF